MAPGSAPRMGGGPVGRTAAAHRWLLRSCTHPQSLEGAPFRAPPMALPFVGRPHVSVLARRAEAGMRSESASNERPANRGARRPRLLFNVNVAWFFLTHRLPIARAARDAGYEV